MLLFFNKIILTIIFYKKGIQEIPHNLVEQAEQIEIEEEDNEDQDNDDIENEIMDSGDLEMFLHGKVVIKENRFTNEICSK